MYELQTQAGTVFALSESLADALAECFPAERQRTSFAAAAAGAAGDGDDAAQVGS